MDLFKEILYFFSFQNHNINMVLIGTILLGFACGLVGVITMLNKRTLIVDSIAHSILPGICVGFLFAGTKNPFFLIPGGIISGALSVLLVNWISSYKKIKTDAAIAVVLSTMFSLGVITLNFVQNTNNPNQSGLNDFLFGKAATIVQSDLYLFGSLCFLVIAIIPIFYRLFKIYLFDAQFAKSIGINKVYIQAIISGLIVICTAIGIQTVGIVLMAALIIAPAAAANFWSASFKKSLLISGIIGIACSITGVLCSYLIPDAPTGPWIVVCLALVAISSAFFSPKGIIKQSLNRRSNSQKVLSDNVLKTLYKMGENIESFQVKRSEEEILGMRSMDRLQLIKGLKSLKKKGLVVAAGNKWMLSEKGVIEGGRIVKIHRLWELYLQKYMHLAEDHVHDSAETIEHLLTPELEKALEKKLGTPTLDPHNKKIPYHEE